MKKRFEAPLLIRQSTLTELTQVGPICGSNCDPT